MFANPSNYEDVKKYYQGTYIKYYKTGDVIWFVEKVDSRMIHLSGTNQKEDESVVLDLTKECRLDYILPSKATFQYGKHAVQLARNPARQWKKGMCAQNTNFSLLNDSSNWVPKDFNIEIIESFVNKPSYYSCDLALATMQEGELISAALSPRFSISYKGRIYLDKVFIGKFNNQTKELVVKTIFVNDVKELFPTNFKIKSV